MVRLGHRPVVAAVVCAALMVGAAAGTVVRLGDRRPAVPSRVELRRLDDRIFAAAAKTGELPREGIYVVSLGSEGRGCSLVTMVNPTPANVEYMRRQFGAHVCVDSRAETELPNGCAGYRPREPLPRGAIRVPQLAGLDVYTAEQRLVTARLHFTTACLYDEHSRPERPDPQFPDGLARIVVQCPHAGELVRRGTVVAFRAEAVLPGGFRWTTGALVADDPESVCGDGRNFSTP